MLIKRTTRQFKRRVTSWQRGYVTNDMHMEIIIRFTYWILFIPVYTKDEIFKSNL